MKSKLALSSPPAVSTPFLGAGVTSPTSLLSVFLHHRPKRIDARGQAKPIEARRHLVPSFAHSPHIRRRQYSRCCANSFHGVAFLSWNQHPKPTGLRRATPLPLFQHSAGQSQPAAARGILSRLRPSRRNSASERQQRISRIPYSNGLPCSRCRRPLSKN